MIGEVSPEEDEEARGLLTVVAVHKTGDLTSVGGVWAGKFSRWRPGWPDPPFARTELHRRSFSVHCKWRTRPWPEALIHLDPQTADEPICLHGHANDGQSLAMNLRCHALGPG